MSKGNVRRSLFLEKNRSIKEQEKPNQGFLSRHFKKIYPLSLQKSTSSLSLSSLSLSLSQNSNDSSLKDYITPLDRQIALSLRLIAPPERREVPVAITNAQQQPNPEVGNGEVRRCNWITKNSDKVYVEFHDECWGVPVYEDNLLFELLAMSGMLMDYNWTEILKRKELLRDAFSGFDPNAVAQMGEKEITEAASNKALMLAESRVRCIVDNAKCIQKASQIEKQRRFCLVPGNFDGRFKGKKIKQEVGGKKKMKAIRQFGSFSSYIWGFVNHKPMIIRCRYPRSVPLRTPKSEAMSRDLIKRGFRLVGPVIVYSFMQAAGMTNDHLIDCFRYRECLSLAQRQYMDAVVPDININVLY